MAVLHRQQILRLAERHGVAFAAPQACVARRRSLYDPDAEILIAQTVEGEQLACREGD